LTKESLLACYVDKATLKVIVFLFLLVVQIWTDLATLLHFKVAVLSSDEGGNPENLCTCCVVGGTALVYKK